MRYTKLQATTYRYRNRQSKTTKSQRTKEVTTGPSDADVAAANFPALTASNDSDTDALYDQAVFLVTESRRASISGVQRRLKIGYNRAARMIEQMEDAGIVTSLQSNGNREVIAPPPSA